MFRMWRLATEGPVKPASTPKKRTQLDDQLCEQIAKLQTVAQHLVPGSIEAETKDHEDHTFSGIMFLIECQNHLPIQFIEIQSVAVRGELGTMSVYTCSYDPSSHQRLYRVDRTKWERRFGPEDVRRSPRRYTDLRFNIPLRLAPGQLAGIYIHSELEGDMALVYDDLRSGGLTYSDRVLGIHPGFSHTSNVPFSDINMWGGNAWRANREFVGRIRYGIKFFMWTPIVHESFPSDFKGAAFALLCCHHVLGKKRMKKATLGDLPLDVIFKILNLVPHSWFETPQISRAAGNRSRANQQLSYVVEDDVDEMDEEEDYDPNDDDYEQDEDMDEVDE